jgi:hypothetical protein
MFRAKNKPAKRPNSMQTIFMSSRVRAFALAAVLTATLSGCLSNDAQRVMVGAAGGAVVADLAGGDMAGGAIAGGIACGLFCR